MRRTCTRSRKCKRLHNSAAVRTAGAQGAKVNDLAIAIVGCELGADIENAPVKAVRKYSRSSDGLSAEVGNTTLSRHGGIAESKLDSSGICVRMRSGDSARLYSTPGSGLVSVADGARACL